MSDLEEFNLDRYKDKRDEFFEYLTGNKVSKQLSRKVVLIRNKYQSKTESNQDNKQVHINEFLFTSSKQPIFKDIKEKSDVEHIIDYIVAEAKNLSQSLAETIDFYEEEIEEKLLNSLDMILRLVDKFYRALEKRKSKVIKMLSSEKIVSVADMQEEFYQIFSKLLKQGFIERIIPAIYEGMKHGNIVIYNQFLKKINKFLAEFGISTIEAKVGEEVDYDLFIPQESDENITTDYKKKDVIKEIKQFPYSFGDKYLISDGKAVVWRFKANG